MAVRSSTSLSKQRSTTSDIADRCGGPRALLHARRRFRGGQSSVGQRRTSAEEERTTVSPAAQRRTAQRKLNALCCGVRPCAPTAPIRALLAPPHIAPAAVRVPTAGACSAIARLRTSGFTGCMIGRGPRDTESGREHRKTPGRLRLRREKKMIQQSTNVTGL